MVQATLPVRPSTQKRMRPDQGKVDGRDKGEGGEPGPSKRRSIRRSPSLLTEGTNDKEKQNSPSNLPVSLSLARHEPQLLPDGRALAIERSHRMSSPTRSRTPHYPSSGHVSPTAAETSDACRRTEDVEDGENDMMNLDGDHEPSFGASSDIPIVLDTSAAVWNRLTPSRTITSAHAKDVHGEPGKLVSSLHGAWRSEVREKKEVRRKVDPRNRLAGFARTGSQIPVVIREDEDDDDGGEDGEAEKNGQQEKTQQVFDGGSGKEIDEEDQLDPSDDLSPSKSPALESVDKIQEDNLTRSSSPIDVDLDLEIGQSSSYTINLSTSDDGFDDSHVHSMVDESSSVLHHEEAVSRPEVVRSSEIDGGDITLRFDIAKLSAAWCNLEGESPSSPEVDPIPPPQLHVPSAAGVSNTENDESAAKALSRIIDKKDFAIMDIVGQFNLGFIVARRRKAVSEEDGHGRVGAAVDDLFIVDQHAADEKYNFETLQQTTVVNSQKLFQ